jgi:hypothetical protein
MPQHEEGRERHARTGDPGYKVKAEFNEKPHVRGVISMAALGIRIQRVASSSSATATRVFSTGNTRPSAPRERVTTFWKRSPTSQPNRAAGREEHAD